MKYTKNDLKISTFSKLTYHIFHSHNGITNTFETLKGFTLKPFSNQKNYYHKTIKSRVIGIAAIK